MSSELILRRPRVEQTAEGSIARVQLDSPDGVFDLFFDVNGAKLEANATAFMAMCLPLAMSRGWNLRSEAPVSTRLMSSVKAIQDIYRLFLPGTSLVNLDAPVEVLPAPSGRNAASFFSGGVDSYYTYLKHRERITRLIFAVGFDMQLSQTSFANLVQKQIREAADKLGVGLISIRSNIHDFSDKYVHWRYYHGAVLGGVASLLSSELDTVYIASSHNYSDLFPWGSHPILDPHWSTEAVQVINDGCEATRLQKLALVAQNDVALQTLRVCFNNKNDRYNCNRCEKCFRTKIALYALGALERCQTFQPDFDFKRMAKLRYGNNGNVVRANQENLVYLRQHRPHAELERALRLARRKPSVLKSVKQRVRSLFRAAPARPASTALGASVR